MTREEFLEVPPWADDRLLVRLDELKRMASRTARLHTHEPLWSTSTTVTIRSLVLGFGIILLFAVLLTENLQTSGYVYFEQERVSFDEPQAQPGSEVYVFYPGLTIEAERESF